MKFLLIVLSLGVFLGAGVQAASAQATRTWVSGVGDDANPCSRTAPCKTFAGAISKTSAGGEIDALDSGGFGGLTITKAITLDGQGVLASALVATSPAFTVNAGANDSVVIRNISIQGNGTGTNGVNFVAGHALTLQNVTISGFSQYCVNFQPAGLASFLSTDSVYEDCTSGGVVVSTTSTTGLVRADLERNTIARTGIGLSVGTHAVALVRNSLVDNNVTGGAQVSGSNAGLVSESTSFSNNFGYGLSALGGGRAALAQSTIILNMGPAFTNDAPNGSSISSFGNNYVAGNNPDVQPTTTVTKE